jgi:hypothetical protein
MDILNLAVRYTYPRRSARHPECYRRLSTARSPPGLARPRVSRKELLAEADLYPWVGERPEVDEPLPMGVMFRARAVELMDYLVRDASFSPIEEPCG